MLEIHNSQVAIIAQNDNWREDTANIDPGHGHTTQRRSGSRDSAGIAARKLHGHSLRKEQHNVEVYNVTVTNRKQARDLAL